MDIYLLSEIILDNMFFAWSLNKTPKVYHDVSICSDINRDMSVSLYMLKNIYIFVHSSVCDDPLSITLHQKGKATRPAGNATLVCEMSGVPIDNMEVYRWTIYNKMESLFVYWVSDLVHQLIPQLISRACSELFIYYFPRQVDADLFS